MQKHIWHIFIFQLCLLPYVADSVLAADCPADGRSYFPAMISNPLGDSYPPLVLNGIGSRTKFFIDVYLAALYLTEQSSDVAAIRNSAASKRIALHFLQSVSAAKLIEGWQDGFEQNLSATQLALLEPQLQQSLLLFTDMQSGDRITFDLIPGQGTIATVNNNPPYKISGDAFTDAVLMIWLGDHPPQQQLKTCILNAIPE